ncbi:MAG TPA: hypothetical protein VMH89_12040 [Candidatus Acidoferrum sp.]|nr:hypothetical protein [Candidatus Acidoferrum sp.]
MKRDRQLFWVMAIGFGLVCCSKKTDTPKTDSATQPAATSASTPAASGSSTATAAPEAATPSMDTASKDASGVKAEMRNVQFHLLGDASAHLEMLNGELLPTGKHPYVVFDDKSSFTVHVNNGTITITPEALAEIMNKHVFAKSDAPLKDLTVAIDKNRLIIKGKLHSKGDIPFGTAGTLSVTDDGRMRVHTEKITAMKLPLKGVMGLFGIELANVVNTSKIDGMDTDKNDLLMDLGKLLPPPHIQGKLTGVRIEPNAIVTIFGDGGKTMGAPKEKGGYMAFNGGTVKFGNVLMEPTDLTVLNVDGGSGLDWNQDRYKDQLVAGYSKITPAFGLRAYVKDFSKLGRGTAASDSKPK